MFIIVIKVNLKHMKYFVIFYIDCKTYKNVNLKGQYTTQEDAQNDLLPNALEYVRSEQGKQQADIALQNAKSTNELLIDESFKEGLYIKQEDNTIAVYNKFKEVIPGAIWNSYQLKINKVGIFGVSEIELNVSIPIPPPTISFVQQSKRRTVSVPTVCYLEELKQRLSNNKNFGLRQVVRNAIELQEIEMQNLREIEEVDDYDYEYNYDS